MAEIVASTVIYLPPADVYDFLVDFPRYADYSEHLNEVWQEGDGTEGTEYALQFQWWKLTYTLRSEVTDLDSPRRIDWRVVQDFDAQGCWRVDPLAELPEDAPADAETACRVSLEVEYDPNSIGSGMLDLPMFVSMDWVLKRVQPKAVREAERVVKRIVADLEGRERSVEVDMQRTG